MVLVGVRARIGSWRFLLSRNFEDSLVHVSLNVVLLLACFESSDLIGSWYRLFGFDGLGLPFGCDPFLASARLKNLLTSILNGAGTLALEHHMDRLFALGWSLCRYGRRSEKLRLVVLDHNGLRLLDIVDRLHLRLWPALG